MYITKIKDIPKELLSLFNNDNYGITKTSTLEDIIDVIRDYYTDMNETVDDFYITKTYIMSINDWELTACSSLYLKDQSICDEEMEEGIEIISISEREKQKEQIKNKEKNTSDKEWKELLTSVIDEKIIKLLSDEYKFPTKWIK